MLVRWSVPASRDFYDIARYLRNENPSSAAEILKRLHDNIVSLGKFPRRARAGRVPDTREFIAFPLPYIVVYRIKNQHVDILRMYHQAQDWL